ncbi:hypothetical protein EDB69_4125 [Vibrio crassostreae]|nr:hypothetical protein [Vibrio crassostreae]ROO66099.1 hypothetical protein EDB64_4168 [Vibrio crassostreae]ROP03213.1 hypothetical protein EDB63_3960 [Vibrio crassostreae]ROQ72020.1 hypothetical protein EDB72_4014 [Vibrio crassostreae]ROR77629.1 hypothetical protein EDB66_3796 [Vibrio crassostreae]RPE88046.1 hypothetical protein EDB68_4202 [Vibrio crassostreae]
MLYKIKLLLDSIVKSIKYSITNFLSKKIVKSSPDMDTLVVSLTTYNARLKTVFLTLESIFDQNFDNYIVVLYLSTQDVTEDKLPKSILRLKSRGLIIVFSDENIRSYKKIHYALEDYPSNSIITADDDIIYPKDWISNLNDGSVKYPGDIIFNRGHCLSFSNDGNLESYDSFPLANKDNLLYNLPTGVSGILYPTGCFHHDVRDKELFLELAPYADDLWYKVMSFKNGTLCRLATDKSIHFTPILGSQGTSLRSKNLSKGDINNDTQLKSLFEYYSLSHLNNFSSDGLK